MSNKENREPENGYTFRYQNNHYYYGTDEDTEDASETAMVSDEEASHAEIKDQIYHDKLKDLKSQMEMLNNNTHPAFVKGIEALNEEYVKRRLNNQVFYECEVKRIEKEHKEEKEEAHKEFDQKEKELKENLILDLEEKKKMTETERDSIDINSDTVENLRNLYYTNPVRKLRRRGNCSSPAPDLKRRKAQPSSLHINVQLSEDEVNEDLSKIIEATAEKTNQVNDNNEGSTNETRNSSDIRVENGKLYYEKYWYHRGQQIYYEEDGIKNSAVISTINPNEVWVRRTSDNEKYKIHISELLKGGITLKRRSA